MPGGCLSCVIGCRGRMNAKLVSGIMSVEHQESDSKMRHLMAPKKTEGSHLIIGLSYISGRKSH